MDKVKMFNPTQLSGRVEVGVLRVCLELLRARAGESPRRECELDCSAVTGFSMEAIVVLAEAIKEHRRAGGKLRLVRMPPSVLLAMGGILLQLLQEEFTSLSKQMQLGGEMPAEIARRSQHYWNN